MHKLLSLPLLAALALGLAVPAASPDSASAAYKECEFSKRKAKKRKAPVCAKDLGRSKWIVVSGTWRQTLSVHEETDGAVFDGTGTADFRAGGLSGASPFPSKKRPVVSMVSTKMFDHLVEFSATSQGGWTTTSSPSRFYDCSFEAPPGSEPNGFGGIFSLAGRNVRVQWPLGATGFGCNTGPYGTPAPEWRTPVSTYPLKSFRNRRIVVLPIAFSWTDTGDGFEATNSYDGVGRMRRYR